MDFFGGDFFDSSSIQSNGKSATRKTTKPSSKQGANPNNIKVTSTTSSYTPPNADLLVDAQTVSIKNLNELEMELKKRKVNLAKLSKPGANLSSYHIVGDENMVRNLNRIIVSTKKRKN